MRSHLEDKVLEQDVLDAGGCQELCDALETNHDIGTICGACFHLSVCEADTSRIALAVKRSEFREIGR